METIPARVQSQLVKLAIVIKESVPYDLWDESLLIIIRELITQLERNQYGTIMGGLLLAEMKNHIKNIEAKMRYTTIVNQDEACCIV